MAPITSFPDNPHYFMYRGKPLLLISSGDIYYDVFSRNQDFEQYLDLLSSYKCNFTRFYPAGCTAFVPADKEETILPWKRLENGKYDLDTWDTQYFERLHRFVRYAASKDVILDVCMFNGFCTAWPQINNFNWPKMALNAKNNIQGEGCTEMNEFTTLINRQNVARQKQYIRKICTELAPYENIIYDNSDEPDCFGNLPIKGANDWVEAMLTELYAADQGKHMIAQTHIPPLESMGKDWCRDTRTSWTNAEYLCAMASFDHAYGANKPFVLIETLSPGEHAKWDRWWSTMGLVMAGDYVNSSRIHAWSFMLAGGGGFLEWSANFHPGTDGTLDPQPVVMQQKLKLREFMESFDFSKMRAYKDFRGVSQYPGTSPGAWATAIAEPGAQYALYVSHSSAFSPKTDGYLGYYVAAPGSYQDNFAVTVPPGDYRVTWVNPSDGRELSTSRMNGDKGALSLQTPPYAVDVALRILRA